jgi:hypothetical protein
VRGADEIVTRTPAVLSERVAGETVLLDPETGRCVRLNGSGAVVWEALAEPAMVDELAAALAEAAGIDRDRAGADVRAFVAELRVRGLVEVNAPG